MNAAVPLHAEHSVFCYNSYKVTNSTSTTITALAPKELYTHTPYTLLVLGCPPPNPTNTHSH